MTLSHAGTNIALDGSVTTSFISGNTYRINGLAALTGARGSYLITVNGSGITDSTGKPATGAASGSWSNSPFTITSILVPAQTNGPVSSVDVVFSAPIDLSTFSYQDVTLARNGIPVALDGAVTTSLVSGNTYRLNGLTPVTVAPATYVITVTASSIIDAFGNAGGGSTSATWIRVPVTIMTIIVPSQTNGPVSSVDVVFSAAIASNTFTYQDVALTLNGITITLDATVSTSFVSGNTHRISGLAAFTAAAGIYLITINASTISDSFGNAGIGTSSGTWNNVPFIITFTVLTPPGASRAAAYAVYGMQQVGDATISGHPEHAAIWSGTANSFTDLSSPGVQTSGAFGTTGSKQVGNALVGLGYYHAALWSGTSNSFVDLNPPGTFFSEAVAVSGSKQAGYVDIGGYTHAALWSGTSNSFVDLHPAIAHCFTSYALAVSGPQQAGYATIFQYDHAAIWSGTPNSFGDLNPASANSSRAYATTGSQQAGEVDGHAAIWSGTANSAVDLNPTGASDSSACAASGPQQAGYARIGRSSHAALWSGTSSSFVDLHSVLTSNYISSQANGISTNGRLTYVCGVAGSDAILWTIRPAGQAVVYVNRAYGGPNSDGSLQTHLRL